MSTASTGVHRNRRPISDAPRRQASHDRGDWHAVGMHLACIRSIVAPPAVRGRATALRGARLRSTCGILQQPHDAFERARPHAAQARGRSGPGRGQPLRRRYCDVTRTGTHQFDCTLTGNSTNRPAPQKVSQCTSAVLYTQHEACHRLSQLVCGERHSTRTVRAASARQARSLLVLAGSGCHVASPPAGLARRGCTRGCASSGRRLWGSTSRAQRGDMK